MISHSEQLLHWKGRLPRICENLDRWLMSIVEVLTPIFLAPEPSFAGPRSSVALGPCCSHGSNPQRGWFSNVFHPTPSVFFWRSHGKTMKNNHVKKPPYIWCYIYFFIMNIHWLIISILLWIFWISIGYPLWPLDSMDVPMNLILNIHWFSCMRKQFNNPQIFHNLVYWRI